MKRIGVFICHCGINIAGTVDVKRVAEALKDYPGVVLATDYMYMCSDPGQSLIRQSIKDQNLEGVVVAACSPAMHEVTFRKASAQAGLNPYQTEIANIREQVSWVHQDDKEAATQKAIEHIKTIVEKVKYNESLIPLSLSLVKKALVIGGGIAGLQAAIDIASAGYPVVLVERSDRLGGHVGKLSGVYVNFNAARDLLQSKLEAVRANPRIKVFLETEVEELGGYVGNFTARLKHRGGEGGEPTFS
ncbi:MAG: FAD-dependent oxidoreductase, partial [Anaerolineae bacterium]